MQQSKLIITADDFGLTEGINKGIVDAHRNGVITRTSIVANGGAYDHAVLLAQQNKGLKIGIHLTLVEEAPLSSTERVKSLLELNGRTFVKDYKVFLLRYVLRKINLGEVSIELESQIIKVMESGISINHIDSHQHLHMLPGIFRVTLDLANKYKIKKIRIPRYNITNVRSIKEFALTFFSNLNYRDLLRSGLSYADNFWGLRQSGNIKKDDVLSFLDHIKTGTTEMMFHPGYIDNDYHQKYGHWCYEPETEYKTLISETVKEKIKSKKIVLTA